MSLFCYYQVSFVFAVIVGYFNPNISYGRTPSSKENVNNNKNKNNYRNKVYKNEKNIKNDFNNKKNKNKKQKKIIK